MNILFDTKLPGDSRDARGAEHRHTDLRKNSIFKLNRPRLSSICIPSILTGSARLSVLNSVGPPTLRSARLVVGWLIGCSTGFRAGLSQCTVGHRPSQTQKAPICLQDRSMVRIGLQNE
jgi:hypothetical protein